MSATSVTRAPNSVSSPPKSKSFRKAHHASHQSLDSSASSAKHVYCVSGAPHQRAKKARVRLPDSKRSVLSPDGRVAEAWIRLSGLKAARGGDVRLCDRRGGLVWVLGGGHRAFGRSRGFGGLRAFPPSWRRERVVWLRVDLERICARARRRRFRSDE